MYLEELILQLHNEGKSPYEIAEKINKNHMFVRRKLKSMGIKTRDKSEAQSNGLKTGRCKPPKIKNDEDDNGKDS